MHVHNRGSQWIVRVFQTTCLMRSLLHNNERSWQLWSLPPRILVVPKIRVEPSNGLTRPAGDRTNEVEEGWPNSNVTNELVAEEGCSRAPPTEEVPPGSQTDMEQDLIYVGGMTYSGLCLRKAQKGSTTHAECRRASSGCVPC